MPNTSKAPLRYIYFPYPTLSPPPLHEMNSTHTPHKQETIGNVTGNEAWKASGAQDKAQAVDAMKTAGEQRDSSKGFGGVEEKAGNLVGCEGMQKEGAESKKQ